ncbi:MAG: sigma-54 dependent transcriptional regulator [Steroidobacteraceae bacterium]
MSEEVESTGYTPAVAPMHAVPPASPRALLADGADGFGSLIGRSAAMQHLFDQIRRVAPTKASVLIVGESGTGKELVARELHDRSSRAEQPFVAVNCGAIPANLIEAELFGYERGSFTGAVRSHAGYFERAAGGTLFLDEITEMPLEMQVKLLRVLESGCMVRVGGDREIPVSCRVLAATNRDPNRAVSEGRMRGDLLYRIAVFPLYIPLLREREDDAELLARHFLAQLNVEEGADKRLSADSLVCLKQHSWPGNVRELRNAVQRAFILADEELQLRSVVSKPMVISIMSDARALRIPVGTALAEAERWMILATLKECGGNKTRAAALLGVSLKTLYNRLNEYRALGLETTDLTGEMLEAPA